MSEQPVKNNSDQQFFKERTETNVVIQLIHRYLPFWPLFVITVTMSLMVSYVYLRSQPRIYMASGRVLLKDPNRNGSDSKVLDALNIFGEKKIVENEIVVLRSSSVMQEVVRRLNLYATTHNKGRVQTEELYGGNAPVHFVALNKDSIVGAGSHFFTVNWETNSITIEGKQYPIGGTINMGGTVYKIEPTPTYTHSAINGKNYFVVFNSVEGAAGGLVGSLNAGAISNQSTVIDVKLQTLVPEKGIDVLNTLFAVYNEFAIADKNQTAAKTLAFIEDRLRMVIDQLDSVEQGVRNYKTLNNVYDLGAQSQLYMSSVQEFDKRKSEIDIQLDVLNSIADYIGNRGQKPGAMPSLLLVNDPSLSGLLQKLYDAEFTLDQARSVGGEKSDPVITAEETVRRLKESIRGNIGSLRSNLLTARSNINSQLGASTGLLKSIPQKEIGLINISRQQAIKNNIYTFLLQKREETALNSASTIADLRVIERASAGGPISPVPKNYYISGLLIGLLIAAGYIMVREQMNRKVLFRQEIEARVSIPVIAELLQLHNTGTVVIKDGRRTAIAEQFRALRTNLAFMGISGKNNAILLTSSVSGEGKSFTAVNLAISFTLTGKRVALMELDLRKPKLSKILGVERSPGISNYVVGQATLDDVIKPTEHANLFVVSAGAIPPNPSELMLKDRFRQLMEAVKEEFDYVIIDTAPIGPVTDAFLLKSFADCTIYMIRHDVTPKVYLRLIDDLAKHEKFRNLAIVFNGLKMVYGF